MAALKQLQCHAQINGEQVDPLATIVHRDDAYRVGKGLTVRLKELIPRQQFKVPIQAAIGARVVASESISGTAGHCQLVAHYEGNRSPLC